MTFAPPDSYEVRRVGRTTVGSDSSGPEGRSILTERVGPHFGCSKRPGFLCDDTFIVEVFRDSRRCLTLVDDDFDHLLLRRRVARSVR